MAFFEFFPPLADFAESLFLSAGEFEFESAGLSTSSRSVVSSDADEDSLEGSGSGLEEGSGLSGMLGSGLAGGGGIASDELVEGALGGGMASEELVEGGLAGGLSVLELLGAGWLEG